jgi:multicomponent Na+:H+ antiporter subunit G
MIGEAIVLCGAVLTLLSAIGVVRFPDALSRMHALTKASTVGFGLIAIGACLNMTSANDITSVLLAAGLQLFTLPVAATLIAHSTYWARHIPVQLDGEDELRQAADTGRLGRRRLRRAPPAAGDDTDQSAPP